MPTAGAVGFFFRHRSGQLDWEKLEKIDLERVVREVDVDTLQENIAHITFADVSPDDLSYFSDGNFLLVFRMTQLIIEYLVNVQNYLLDLSKQNVRLSRYNIFRFASAPYNILVLSSGRPHPCFGETARFLQNRAGGQRPTARQG